MFQSYSNGITFQAETASTIQQGIYLRRNLVLDSWDISHSQSMYIDGVASLTIAENIIVHKGFDTTVVDSGPGVFSQAITCRTTPAASWSPTTSSSTARATVCSSARWNRGGNLFARNAIGLLIGGGNEPNPGGVSASRSTT